VHLLQEADFLWRSFHGLQEMPRDNRYLGKAPENIQERNESKAQSRRQGVII
jgi:hypothetical protein